MTVEKNVFENPNVFCLVTRLCHGVASVRCPFLFHDFIDVYRIPNSHPFKVDSPAASGWYTESRRCHHCLVSEHVCHPKKKPQTHE